LNARAEKVNGFTEERTIVALFAVFAFAIRVPLAFGPPSALTSRYGDDAFYILSVARNFATGHGLTIDGTHLTNGFQPLIAAIYTLAFWGAGDDWTGVRITVLANALITAATVFAVASVTRALAPDSSTRKQWQRPAPIAAFLWACSISIFHQTTTGLETALCSLLFLLVLREYLRTDLSAWRFGVLLGLAVLARIDAAILVAILVLFYAWRRQYRLAFIAGSIAFLISLPWWLYNLFYFGSIMPTSGQAEISWPTSLSEQLYRLIQTLNDIAIVLIYTPHDSSFLVRIITAIVIALGLFLLFSRTRIVEQLRSTRLNALIPFWIFGFILVIYYTFYFRAPHFIIRYLQPLRILVLLSWALILSELINRYVSAPVKNRLIPVTASVILLLMLGFGVNRYFAFYDKPNALEFYNIGMWANSHPAERIGMLQSGIAGFVAPNIVNLDGKVNAEALAAHQQGQLGRYILQQKFDYLADWKPFVEDVAALCGAHELFFDSIGMVGRIQVMKRRTAPTR
jgi:hypothetical protein